MIIIYKHRNKINGKVYIGQTNNIKRRWNPSRYENSPLFYRAIQKYGWENFTHEILSEIEDQNEADNQEIALIEYFDSTNPEKGYNISYGGNTPLRGRKISEDSKKKMSDKLKGRKISEETRKKMSLAKIGKYSGKNHPRYGTEYRVSEDTKNKISLAAKGSNNPNAHPVYLIDTIDGWDGYYLCIKDICEKHPTWNYKSIQSAARKNSLFKKRYKIEYIN